jgi:hypothetical protein
MITNEKLESDFHSLLCPIRSQGELEKVQAFCDYLMDLVGDEELSQEIRDTANDALYVLGLIILDYENEHAFIPSPTVFELVHLWMEEEGVKKQEMLDFINGLPDVE